MGLWVNGEAVSAASIEQEERQLLAELKVNDPSLLTDRMRLSVKDRAQSNVVDHLLFKQEAVKCGITVDAADVEAQLQWLADRNGGMSGVEDYLRRNGESVEDLRKHLMQRLLVDRWVESIHATVAAPKDRHAKKHYKEHLDSYFQEESAEVRWFVKHYKTPMQRLRARDEVNKVAEAVRAGKSFLTLVKQRSDEPANDGFLGSVRRGELAAEFDAFVFAAQPQEISDAIDRQGTWYLLRVENRQQARQLEFEEVRETILQQLHAQERQAVLQKRIAKLRSKARMEQKAS
ncbi:MAG: peptidyl-prolyl cis-trans isomerase [Puniceicoccaceae bacterium]